jgi:TPR repeat protein
MNRTGFAALAVSAWCACAAPAAAQFYSLEGRFECLNDPKAVCFDATSDGPMARPSEASTPAAESRARPARPRQASPAGVAPRPAEAADALHEIAKRLESGRPAPDDAAALRRLAEGGDTQALELLAWCNLKGMGVARDPLRAYLLYGIAASIGVAGARRNQAIIYENDLTSEQRQQALTIENGVVQAQAE